MGYDRNAELLIDEKRQFLEDKLARNVHLFSPTTRRWRWRSWVAMTRGVS